MANFPQEITCVDLELKPTEAGLIISALKHRAVYASLDSERKGCARLAAKIEYRAFGRNTPTNIRMNYALE